MTLIEEIQRKFWQDVQTRFWNKVEKGTGDACWNWIGAHNSKGYGTVQVYGRSYYVHRFAYELLKGPIPEGKVVMHSCDNPSCVNPKHLVMGTQLDNMRDKVAKGRHRAPGPGHPLAREQNPAAQLSARQVASIRKKQKAGKSYRQLAEEFRVSKSQIARIINNQAWIEG